MTDLHPPPWVNVFHNPPEITEEHPNGVCIGRISRVARITEEKDRWIAVPVVPVGMPSPTAKFDSREDATAWLVAQYEGRE